MRKLDPRALAFGLALFAAVAAPAEEPVRLFRAPTLSAESIVFQFAGDLWSVPRAGGTAKRLTANVGRE